MCPMGIPEMIVRLIHACLQGSKCYVKFEGVVLKDFEVVTGLKQTDTLSPAI